MIILFTLVFIFGIAIGLTIGVFIHPVYGQTPIQIPNPQSGLNFLPQKAYITTITPDGLPVQIPISPQPVQQASAGAGGTFDNILPTLIGSAVAYFAAKIDINKKVAKVEDKVVNVADVTKDNSAEILKGKTIDKELAKVAFNANPIEAEKINDAPLIKLQTLATDETEFATKTAKTSLPTDD